MVMKFFILLFFFISNNVFSQNLYADNNNSFFLELDSIDFNDINIVVLGEERHSDGSVVLLNQEIIKYLVSKQNFEYLIIESDFYSLYKKHHDDIGEYKENIYQNWGQSIYFQEVINLAKNEKLKILGFDSRMRGENSQSCFLEELNILNYNPDSLFLNKIVQNSILFEFNYNINESDLTKFNLIIDSNIVLIQDTTCFLFQQLRNLKNYINQISIEQESVYKYIENREKNMISNCNYLLNKLSDKKIIVLGANLHVQPGIVKLSHHSESNVGDMIVNTKNNYLFLLPFVYKYQTVKNGKIKEYKTKSNYLKFLHRKGYNIKLIDLSNTNSERDKYLRYYSENNFIYIDYSKINILK
jgi:hypothetical protein